MAVIEAWVCKIL